MFEFNWESAQIQVNVQSHCEKPGEGSQHGVVHNCSRYHAGTEDPQVGNAFIYQEGQVQNEHGYQEVNQDLSCLAGFPFSVES